MRDQFRKIWVEWIDSTSYANRWFLREELESILEQANMKCESIGYLLDEDDERIVIVNHLAYGDHGGIHEVHGPMLIPIVAITDWEWLE